MLNPRLDAFQGYAFKQLAGLLDPIPPASNLPPVLLSVGEPQNPPPGFLAEVVQANAHLWNRYPPARGTPAFRAAVAGHLARRYGLPDGFLDPERHIIPVPGTREPLFLIGLVAIPEAKGGGRPAVLLPNPFYHVYEGTAAATGAEPIYLPATKATNFIPDIERVDLAVLDRTALAYLCTPTNPQGTVADRDTLKRWIGLARAHDFLLVVDECYAEIYRDTPPLGALEVLAEMGEGLDNVLVMHSLSKRSSAPGLRVGFLAGDPRYVGRYAELVGYGGVSVPLPLLAAGAALYGEDAHVAANRALYNANYAAAAACLGGRFGHYTPEAGFYLWLEVGDGVAAASRLWREAAIRVLPGSFMGRDDGTGVNPGDAFIRVALVYDTATTAAALERMARVL